MKEEELKEAEITMLGLIRTKKGNYPFIIDNLNLAIKRENGMATLFIQGLDITSLKLSSDEMKDVLFCSDLTTDPTNDIAGMVVSLGYSVFRHKIKNAEIKCVNPLIMVSKDEDLSVHFTRPMRPIIETEEKDMFNKLADPIKDYVLKSIKQVGDINVKS